jgi:hypothetical protein
VRGLCERLHRGEVMKRTTEVMVMTRCKNIDCSSTGMVLMKGEKMPCPVCGGKKLVATPAPKVGDKATFRLHTDCKACEVVHVSKSGKSITLRMCRAILLNGANSGAPDALTCVPGGFAGRVSGTQRWHVESDADGNEMRATLRKNGIWKAAGYSTHSPTMATVTIGVWAHYYDYNF